MGEWGLNTEPHSRMAMNLNLPKSSSSQGLYYTSLPVRDRFTQQHPHLLSASASSSSSQKQLPIINKYLEAPNYNYQQQQLSSRVVINIDDDDDGGDNHHEKKKNKKNEQSDEGGQIQSLPCSSKNGPYTCSRCRTVFLTSQQFAAHVSSVHYKLETKEQRRKRQIAKMKRRTLKILRAKDGSLTIAPLFYQCEEAANQVPGGDNSTNAMFPANGGRGASASSSSSSKVKQELGGGNDSLVPPGFEGMHASFMSTT